VGLESPWPGLGLNKFAGLAKTIKSTVRGWIEGETSKPSSASSGRCAVSQSLIGLRS
jgi:hypothetical protein